MSAEHCCWKSTMKPLEAALFDALRVEEAVPRPFRRSVRKLIDTGAYGPPKRCCYWLQKWTDRQLYDYGVTLDLGWLTDKGREFRP